MTKFLARYLLRVRQEPRFKTQFKPYIPRLAQLLARYNSASLETGDVYLMSHVFATRGAAQHKDHM